eukprot:3537287-Amphidinium_carterae.1
MRIQVAKHGKCIAYTLHTNQDASSMSGSRSKARLRAARIIGASCSIECMLYLQVRDSPGGVRHRARGATTRMAASATKQVLYYVKSAESSRILVQAVHGKCAHQDSIDRSIAELAGFFRERLRSVHRLLAASLCAKQRKLHISLPKHKMLACVA